MQNTQVKIGQAVVSCIALNDRQNELEFTWVQQHRGFEELIEQAVEYDAFQKRSKVRLGDKTKGDKQNITFDPTYSVEEMKDSKEYAVLIRWVPGSNQNPEILGFDDKKAFDNVVAQLEARKNTYVQSERREDAPMTKKNFKFDVVEKTDDPNTYRVQTMNRTKSGKLKDIVKALAEEIEADPMEMLLLGKWHKKGINNKYTPCNIPELPTVPQFLLDAFERNKKKQA